MTGRFQNEIRNLAYDQTPGTGPGLVFLGGFRSDKSGNKALFLEDWAKAKGRAYLRFDYSGHGESSGDVLDLTIGDWIEDAAAIIRGLTQGPQILVGSSMGGWISLVLAQRIPERIAGLVTIAAAPDFTEENYWASFSEADRETLNRDGQLDVPTDYADTPYVITKRLIEEAREHLVLNAPIALPFPTRFLMGTEDSAVSMESTMKLLDRAQGPDVRLTLVKGADHRFSDARCLNIIRKTLEDLPRP